MINFIKKFKKIKLIISQYLIIKFSNKSIIRES
jgi:hypothetical protein